MQHREASSCPKVCCNPPLLTSLAAAPESCSLAAKSRKDVSNGSVQGKSCLVSLAATADRADGISPNSRMGFAFPSPEPGAAGPAWSRSVQTAALKLRKEAYKDTTQETHLGGLGPSPRGSRHFCSCSIRESQDRHKLAFTFLIV